MALGILAALGRIAPRPTQVSKQTLCFVKRIRHEQANRYNHVGLCCHCANYTGRLTADSNSRTHGCRVRFYHDSESLTDPQDRFAAPIPKNWTVKQADGYAVLSLLLPIILLTNVFVGGSLVEEFGCRGFVATVA